MVYEEMEALDQEGLYGLAVQFYQERLKLYEEELEKEYKLGKIFGFSGPEELMFIHKEAHRQALEDTVGFFEELFDYLPVNQEVSRYGVGVE